MNNWKQQKLGIVADVKLSNVDKLTIENERVVRLCNYTDVYKNSFINNEKSKSFMLASCNENEYEKFILKKGQVAITKDSETPNDIGVSTYISEDFEDVVLGYHLALITPANDKLNGQFLHYWLNTKQAKRYFENNAGGSGQRCTLVLDCIKSTPLYLPKLSTQAKIAKVLSDLDAKIELNNRINRELEAMAKTLYDYWFVQFDFPNADGKPYKSSGGKMVYNAELKREIPEGWKVKELGKLIDIQRGISYKSSDITGDGIQMINLNSFNLDGTYKAVGIKTYSGNYSEKQIAKSSDLLIAATDVTRNADIIGKAIMVPHYYDDDVVFSMDIVKIIPKKEISSPYLMMLFNSGHYHNYIKWYASGTIVLHLNMDGVKWYKAEIPPTDLIGKFDSFYLPIANRINETERQNQHLTALRDWLLPMLMNGQVTVRQTHGNAVQEAEERLSMAAEPSVEYKKG